MVHSWPGQHTHHLIFLDQHLPKAFEAPEKISPNFVQDPAIKGFQVCSGKRRFGTWIVWFLPKNWRSWEEAFQPHHVKKKYLQEGCAKCT